jgi:hypothetical protein
MGNTIIDNWHEYGHGNHHHGSGIHKGADEEQADLHPPLYFSVEIFSGKFLTGPQKPIIFFILSAMPGGSFATRASHDYS